MQPRTIALVGGTGFVGRALGERLTERGKALRVLTRRLTNASSLLIYPMMDVRVGNSLDVEFLSRAFDGVDAVVNLAGILHERGGQTFQSVHVDLPRRLANACRAAGVRRMVHMSALGAAENAPSEYLRSKALGEKAVVQGAGDGIGVTIVRPSVIFGRHDAFVNRFAAMARVFPVIPLPGAEARFQPIWVEDVARVIALALDDGGTAGKSYNLCGPKPYALREIVELAALYSGHPRRVIAVPDWAARLQAAVLEHLPGPLLTRDNLRSMEVPNVCDGPFPDRFGFAPSALESVAPQYLADASPRGRYDRYRFRAGR
ncbi:hypothetical protein DSM104443_03559 [Usitatibacter rugosus]|uniref:NAD-dependent epimerase/dehydratase domain-containing protein n=1 Tax=Usitatibacter rugosus TaxID=2732067 RepID=A0A6M4H1D5_9PROT|nr:complex I NDUFA9 subunit family protein [Usitatibacter rugosus]QJR12473.1 hypothetical protein DSM104443_03559 [Usitatibacter rugosus]